MTKKKISKKIVVLLSGGLDSSTLAYFAARDSKPHLDHRVYTLTFDYGQRHKRELESAYKISKAVGVLEHKIVKFDLTNWGGSALTDNKLKVPLKRNLWHASAKLINKSIPNTYVPARNTIFLSFALSYAEAIGALEIYIGVNSVDYSGYVDCRGEFIRSFQDLVKVATVAGVNGRPVKIKTPLINMTKADIVRLGTKLEVDWSKTWSCYLGEKLACGSCDSCQLRLKGFVQAGIIDPIKYKTFPKFYKEWLNSLC